MHVKKGREKEGKYDVHEIKGSLVLIQTLMSVRLSIPSSRQSSDGQNTQRLCGWLRWWLLLVRGVIRMIDSWLGGWLVYRLLAPQRGR